MNEHGPRAPSGHPIAKIKQRTIRRTEVSLARGEGRPLDVETVITRVRGRLAEQGAAD